MHVTGIASGVGAALTGLIIADILYHWRGASRLAGQGSKFGIGESRLLAGRG